MRGCTALLLLFGALLLADSPPGIVTSVTVRGGAAGVALTTQVGQPYDAATVERDLRRLWSTGRFEDIRVEKQDQPEGTDVIFEVVEAKRLQLHEMKIEPSTFGLQMALPEGTPIDRLRAHQIANQARSHLIDDGFQDAEVDYKIVPFAGKQADLHLMVTPGDRVRVKEVTFEGDTELDSKELTGALRALKTRRVLPGIPGVWGGWRQYPAYSWDAVQSDVAHLRSLFVSKGYFDANVRLDDVAIDHDDARVRIVADAGPRYQVRSLDLAGTQVPFRDLCSRLFAEQREAERAGILDFGASVRVQPDLDNSADLTASIERGRPYEVGKIEFTGNRHFTEAFLRRNLLLDEGDVFDERRLRRSLARLNQTGLFEPVSEHNTVIDTDQRTGIANINIRLMERKRNAWNISGPVGPASFAGPLVGTVSSRLPSWGSGVLELSTYTASISMFAFAGPLMHFVAFGSKLPTWLPILALHRPYSAGEGWKSGFVITPELGWQFQAMTYSITQAQQRLLPVLWGDRGLVPELPVTVETPKGQAFMYCEPPNPRLSLLRNAASFVLRFAGAFAVF